MPRPIKLLFLPLLALGLLLGATRHDGKATVAAQGTRIKLRQDASDRLQPAGPSRGDRIARSDNETLISLDFEAPEFPPEGWMLLDNVNERTGRESRQAWSRQTCEKPDDGGEASVWSAGGGLDGAKTACGENIGLGTWPWLIHPGLDISAYPGGIQIDFSVWMDMPLGKNLLYVCSAPEGSSNFNCATLGLPNEQLRARWLTLNSPIWLEDTAGASVVQVAFVFNDKDGAGDYPGVFLDNITIEALDEAPATPEATATSTRRASTATRTPTRTRFTPTPTPRPTLSVKVAYLPMLSRNKEGYEPNWITISFGDGLGDDNHVSNAGTQYQFGTMSLCGELNWGGFAPSTELRWQWFRRVNGEFEEIASATLNGSVVVGDEPEHFVSTNCLAAVVDGEPAPLPVNDYRLDVFVEPSQFAFGSNVASITTDPPPGKTPIGPRPTAQPTGRPSATPKATPGSGGESCSNVDNADFERGPSAGWSLRTNVQAPNDTTDRVIRRSEDVFQTAPPEVGEYLAVLGGANQVQDNLISSEFALPEASEIVSATLNFDFLMFTEEAKNSTNDDTAVAFMMSQDGQAVAVPGTGISEEILDPNTFYNLREPLDVMGLVTKREGWDSAQLGFQSLNSADAPSYHVFDNVSFQLCVKSLFGLPVGWSSRLPLGRMPLLSPVPYRTTVWDVPVGQLNPLGRSFRR